MTHPHEALIARLAAEMPRDEKPWTLYSIQRAYLDARWEIGGFHHHEGVIDVVAHAAVRAAHRRWLAERIAGLTAREYDEACRAADLLTYPGVAEFKEVASALLLGPAAPAPTTEGPTVT
jgi:hypothetical protein